MADCAKYRELVSGYADGELTEADEIELKRHLEGCASCRALLTVYQAIHEDFDESETEPPEGFSAGVMKKIKALNDNENQKVAPELLEASADDDKADMADITPTRPAQRKTRNANRSMIITFVAAAACLALVFILTPQLFLGGSRSTSTASQPEMYKSMASAASSPEPKVGSVPAPAGGGGGQPASMKTADNGAEQGDVADSKAQFGTLVVPAETAMPPASATPAPSAAQPALPTPMPSAAPSAAPASSAASATPSAPSAPSIELKLAPDPSPDPQKLRDYYAVIMIRGTLPDLIAGNARTSNTNGTFNIEVTVDMANQLVKDGYTAHMGAPDKKTALVIYSPS